MKFRIQSRARSSQTDYVTQQVRSKFIFVNEVLEFDHHPSGEEILSALARLPKYQLSRIQLLDTLAIQKLKE